MRYGSVGIEQCFSEGRPVQTNNRSELQFKTPERPIVVKATSIAESASRSAAWSESLQTVLAEPPANFPLRLLLGGLLFTAGVVTWASVGTLQEVGHARGQLIPQGDVFKVHPVQPGKMTRLMVQEGQAVKAGDAIAQLDPQDAENQVDRLEKQIAADQVQLLQLQGLVDRLRLEQQNQVTIVAANTQAQRAAIAQAESGSSTAQTMISQLQADAELHKRRLDRLQPLAQQGAIAQEQLFEVEQSWRDRTRSLVKSQGELQQATAEVSRLQAELAQKQAEGNRSLLEVQQRSQQVQVEITQVQARLTETRGLLANAKAKLQQQVLRSPVDGTVSSLLVRNPGEVVQPGQTLAEISPQQAPLILRSSLPAREAGFVRQGMTVQLKFDAYPYQDFGMVSGKVRSISPDAKSNGQTEPAYVVEVVLDRDYMIENQQKIPLRAGQVASAEIVIRQRKIIDMVLDPIRQLQQGGINL
jgi:HlyD family type I secretion membrane fusion protein